MEKFLLHQLIQFGLNPKEWEMIFKEGKGVLTHWKDKSFCLEGDVILKNKKWEWANLTLLSL